MAKKLPSTMAKIGTVREWIDADLKLFDQEKFDQMGFLVYIKDVGAVAPNGWVKLYFSDHLETWSKFMNGQSCCPAGYYLRDVERFLNILESKYEAESIPPAGPPARTEYPETD